MNPDELDGPSQVPLRPRKVARKRAGNSEPEQTQEPAENPGFAVPTDNLAPDEREIEVDENVSNVADAEMENELTMENNPDAAASIPMRLEAENDHHEQQMAGEEEKEEDTVVREFDVFLNPSIGDDTKLYVVQYTLRPKGRLYGVDERCQEVRMKPKTNELEIDLSMDVDSNNYDKETGDRLKMTKQTLAGKLMPFEGIDHVIGVLLGNKLVLNPVHDIVKFRPSMEYLSSTRKEKKDWIPLRYNGYQSDVSSRIRQKMMATDTSPIAFGMNSEDYSNSICPRGKTRVAKPPGRIILSMPLKERIEFLLSGEAPCRPFTFLKHFCPEDSNEEVFRVLLEQAWLIQGVWTLKTRLLKLDKALSVARDYVLTLFRKDPSIKASKIDKAGRYKTQVKVILKTLATERPILKDWKFIEETDASFIEQFPEIVKQQDEILKQLEEWVMSIIESSRPKPDSRKNVRTKPVAAVKSQKPESSDKGETRNVAEPSTRTWPKNTQR